MYFLLFAPTIVGIWLAIKAMTSKYSLPQRIALALLFLLSSQSFTIQQRLLGSLAGPDVPLWVMALLVCSFCTLVLVFLGSAVWDLIRLVLKAAGRLFFRPAPADTGDTSAAGGGSSANKAHKDDVSQSRRLFLAATAASGMRALVPAGIITSGAGFYCAIDKPVLREWEVTLPDVPTGLDGFKIIHMADLHIGPLWDMDRAVCIRDMVERAEADIVCLSGDLADGEPDWTCADKSTRRNVARLFGGLKSRFGTYACTGNHEYFSKYSAWMAIWKDLGIHFLHNTCTVIPATYNSFLVLGGLDDEAGRTRGHKTHPFAEAPAWSPAHFRVLLDHRPMSAVFNTRYGAGLQLSGHTHGGHCPGLADIIARANKGFVRDWYDLGSMALYVTSGVSQWSGFALRLGIPSEVALLTLRRSPDGRMYTRLLSKK